MTGDPVPRRRERYTVEWMDNECLIYRSPAKTAIPIVPRSATDQPSHFRTPSASRAWPTLADILACRSIRTSDPWLNRADDRPAAPRRILPAGRAA